MIEALMRGTLDRMSVSVEEVPPEALGERPELWGINPEELLG